MTKTTASLADVAEEARKAMQLFLMLTPQERGRIGMQSETGMLFLFAMRSLQGMLGGGSVAIDPDPEAKDFPRPLGVIEAEHKRRGF